MYLCENYGNSDVTDKWGCINSGGEWKNSYLNFDNVIQGMATMFVIFNSVQWSEIMFHAANTIGKDLMPVSAQ